MADEEDRDDLEQENEEQEQEEQEEYVSKEEYDKLRQQVEKLRGSQKKSNKEAEQRRHKLNEYKERLQRYEIDPDDPEQLEEVLAEYKNSAEKKGEQRKDADVDKLRKQLEDEKKKAIEERDSQIRQMENTVHKYLVENQAAAAITEYDGVPKLLMPHIKENVSVQKTDKGDYAVRILDEDGDARFNSEGEYMTIKDLVSEMKESDDFGMAFKARAPSGSGSDPSGKKGNKGAPKNMKRSEMSRDQKAEYMRKHGADAYWELPQ